MEDGTDAEEKPPQSSTELRNEVELHHLAQMVVVAGGVRLELRETNDSVRRSWKDFKTEVFLFGGFPKDLFGVSVWSGTLLGMPDVINSDEWKSIF